MAKGLKLAREQREREASQRMQALNRSFQRLRESGHVIQCSECPNHVQAGEFTEQELIADGWLLEPVVYCPKCGEDEE